MSPAEIKHLYKIALQQSNDPARARRMLEAFLAGQDRLLPRKERDNVVQR